MAIPYQAFKDAGADVGAGVTEAFLNRFATAHFAGYPAVYGGQYESDQFEQKIRIEFQAQNPLVFTLAPLGPNKFGKLWVAHLQARGSKIKTPAELITIPPDVEVTTSKMKFVITVFKADGSVDFSV